MLLTYWLDIVAAWRPAFMQNRLWRRAVIQALGTLTAFGRRTLSRAIFAVGHQHQDWSADYRLHSRSAWNVDELFQPVLERSLPLCDGPFIAVALDDTRIHKTGRKIRSAFFQRDPLSPKFRFNLMWGLALPASLPTRAALSSPARRPTCFAGPFCRVSSRPQTAQEGAPGGLGCLPPTGAPNQSLAIRPQDGGQFAGRLGSRRCHCAHAPAGWRQ